MDLIKWKRIFLDSKNEPKIHDNENSVKLTFKKPLLTREKLIDSTLYDNLIFQDQKYAGVEFLSKESTGGGIKYIICNQMLLCSTRCLKIEKINTAHYALLQELSHFFELSCYLMQTLGLTLAAIIKKNHEKRKRLGNFSQKIYFKYKEVFNAETKQMEKVKYQKIVRNGIVTAVQKDNQFIETQKDGLIHKALIHLPCEDKAGNMVRILVNPSLSDNSCCYLDSMENNPTAVQLALCRKLNEETREVIESNPSNYLNEMGDILEVYFQLLEEASISFKHILLHIQNMEMKFGKLNVYVKGISLTKIKEA